MTKRESSAAYVKRGIKPELPRTPTRAEQIEPFGFASSSKSEWGRHPNTLSKQETTPS
jgi:hypothetical protein